MIAVIVDNRVSFAKDAISKHMPHLDGWDLDWVSPDIKSSHDYNKVLTSIEFWERYQDHQRVLIFQHDSGILRKGIDEFFEWDYVGAPWFENAPWARQDRAGGNGGLSLRCPKKALELIRRHPYKNHYNEDVYFTHKLDLVGAKVAPYDVCKKFSVETDFSLGTLGYHAIDKHLSKQECQQIMNQYK